MFFIHLIFYYLTIEEQDEIFQYGSCFGVGDVRDTKQEVTLLFLQQTATFWLLKRSIKLTNIACVNESTVKSN